MHDVVAQNLANRLDNRVVQRNTRNDPAIRRFNEPVLVDLAVGGKRSNQTDVWPFRRLDWANTTVVRRVHIAHVESCPVTTQTAGPERREATLVCQLSERV